MIRELSLVWVSSVCVCVCVWGGVCMCVCVVVRTVIRPLLNCAAEQIGRAHV